MLIEGAKPIWPDGVEIPVLGVTGGYGSGKTLWLLTIAPGNHPEGHKFAGKPRTRYYDFELSGAAYNGLGMDRIKVQEEMLKTHPKGYKPIDVFKWWLADVAKIQPGQFDVIAGDTAGDLESGLADYIRTQYKEYGFSSEEKFESMGGVFWKYVKEFLKMKLSDLATRCQTFAFSAHLQKVWKDGKATSREKPAGKSTLMELSTLYLWLDRSPDGQGKVPEAPRCKEMLKNRLVHNSFDAETGVVDLHPYLPPAFANATPATIRQYILKPADYKKLKKEELVVRDQMTREEELQAEQDIAQMKLDAENAGLARINRMAELQSAAAKAKAGQSVDTPAEEPTKPAANKTTETTSAATEAAEQPAPTPGQEPSITQELIDEINKLKTELSMPDTALIAGLKKGFGGKAKLPDLTLAEGRRLAENFKKLLQNRKGKQQPTGQAA